MSCRILPLQAQLSWGPLTRSHSFRLNGQSFPFRSGASTPCQASPCGGHSCTCSPPCSAIRSGPQCLGYYSGGCISPPADPTPEVPLAVASAALPTTGSTPLSMRVNAQVHNRASEPESIRIYRRHRCVGCCWPRSPPPSILFNEPSKACAIIHPQRSPSRRTIPQLCRRQHCRPWTPLLCRHRTVPSHCPASAMRPLALLLLSPLPLSPSRSPLWPPPPGRHAVTDAAHGTAPLRSRRIWGDKNAKRRIAEWIRR